MSHTIVMIPMVQSVVVSIRLNTKISRKCVDRDKHKSQETESNGHCPKFTFFIFDIFLGMIKAKWGQNYKMKMRNKTVNYSTWIQFASARFGCLGVRVLFLISKNLVSNKYFFKIQGIHQERKKCFALPQEKSFWITKS